MKLKDLLSEKRSALLKRWFDKSLEIYPADTTGFMKDPRKQFANPVGYTFSQELENIFDGLLGDADLDTFPPFLDSIIRIRAIQGLKPSQALSFMLHLKTMIREELGNDGTAVQEELSTLEGKIDALTLLSFDIYLECREKIYDLKAKEVQNRTFRLLQRANILCEVEEQ